MSLHHRIQCVWQLGNSSKPIETKNEGTIGSENNSAKDSRPKRNRRKPRTGTSPLELLVLANLAYRADRDSLTCFPSTDRIAADTAMSRRGVQKVIEKLVKRGLVTVISSGSGKGRNAPNHYRLNFLEMTNPVRYSQGNEWRTEKQGMANSTTINGEPRSHEPLNLKETMRSADALALEARAPRRPRSPDPGESPKEKEERQLRELAEMFGLTQRPEESDFAFRRRVQQFNDRRIEAIA